MKGRLEDSARGQVLGQQPHSGTQLSELPHHALPRRQGMQSHTSWVPQTPASRVRGRTASVPRTGPRAGAEGMFSS